MEIGKYDVKAKDVMFITGVVIFFIAACSLSYFMGVKNTYIEASNFAVQAVEELCPMGHDFLKSPSLMEDITFNVEEGFKRTLNETLQNNETD